MWAVGCKCKCGAVAVGRGPAVAVGCRLIFPLLRSVNRLTELFQMIKLSLVRFAIVDSVINLPVCRVIFSLSFFLLSRPL